MARKDSRVIIPGTCNIALFGKKASVAWLS